MQSFGDWWTKRNLFTKHNSTKMNKRNDVQSTKDPASVLSQCSVVSSSAMITECKYLLNLSHSVTFMWLLAERGTIWTLNKASFSSPRDDCVKRLTSFRVGPRPLGTQCFMTHFQLLTVFEWVSWQYSRSIYLCHQLWDIFAWRQSGNWAQERSWGSQPTWACGFEYNRQKLCGVSRIWVFYGWVGCEIPDMGQIQPTEATQSFKSQCQNGSM